jgi:hypothetical protein
MREKQELANVKPSKLEEAQLLELLNIYKEKYANTKFCSDFTVTWSDEIKSAVLDPKKRGLGSITLFRSLKDKLIHNIAKKDRLQKEYKDNSINAVGPKEAYICIRCLTRN